MSEQTIQLILTTAISLFGLLGSIVAVYKSNKNGDKVEANSKVVDANTKIVDALREQLQLVREARDDCREQNAQNEAEIEKLKDEIDRLKIAQRALRDENLELMRKLVGMRKEFGTSPTKLN